MTRKDYELIATGIREVAKIMATLLERDNPRFDRQLFLAACGVSESSVADVKHSRRVKSKLVK